MTERLQVGFNRATLLAGMIGLTMLAVFTYLLVRTALFLVADYLWYEKLLAGLLLLAETFILIHSLGYFLNIFHVTLAKADDRPRLTEAPPLTEYPPVAIIVSSYHEPLEVVEDTLTCFYNLTYPNKHLYFLDDTRYDLPGRDPEEMAAYRRDIDDMCARIGVNLFRRRWHGAKAGMINDFLAFLDGRPPEGFEFTSFEDTPRTGPEKYIIVFDADMNAIPDFAEPLVAIMEHNPKLAFVQTPQYYTNFEGNRVARASGLQQAVFYEYICEGKSIQDAMFCCGTNVIFRREALMSVGGFDESSVTEDFATSLKFHIGGWSSAYLNKVCAFGMGPEDLLGYFKQQFRWSLGTVGLFRTILINFLKNPRGLPLAKWWEYFLSGTHYFVGWVFFIMMICPILYLTAGVPTYFAHPDIYILVFVPYLVLSMSVFIWTLSERRYKFKDVATGMVLNGIAFPVYMKASLLGMIGVRGSFGITPKGGATFLPLRGLWPQIAGSVVAFAATAWGLMRIYFEREPTLALAANTWWAFYHGLVLTTVLYFNHPEVDRDQ